MKRVEIEVEVEVEVEGLKSRRLKIIGPVSIELRENNDDAKPNDMQSHSIDVSAE